MLVHEWKNFQERGEVRSHEPWWAPTISLEQLIISGAVNLGGRRSSLLVTVYCTDVDICVLHGGHKAGRVGLSVASEAFCLFEGLLFSVNVNDTSINVKNCSLDTLLMATDLKPQKS